MCHQTNKWNQTKRISLTLSRYPSLLFTASTDPQSYILYLHRVAVCWFELVALRLLSLVKSTSLMSSFLLLQQCSACLVRLILIVFVMGGRWPYSCCFVEFCLQYLFNIDRSILVLLLSSFFSIPLVSVHVVHPYSSIDWHKIVEKCLTCHKMNQPTNQPANQPTNQPTQIPNFYGYPCIK